MEQINVIKFNELEKRIFKMVCELGCNILKNILESQDKELMEKRDKKEYRHKGYRNNTVKTVMGEVEYKRAIYLKDKKHIYLLDQELSIDTIGKISSNLAELMLNTVVNTVSYRKGAREIQNLTNETISHQALQQLVWYIGADIEKKEKEEIKLMKQGKLFAGTKKTPALFEEADGIWVNLQGKDREEQIEKYKRKCERQNKKYEPLQSVKSELKLHITYEGWKKDSNRHELVNKNIIAGMMTPKTLQKLRNARVYQMYDEESIELRASNGDGATWITNIATEDTICQKDLFHIQQEITRDIKDKKHRQGLVKLIANKNYDYVHDYIENLKYEVGGEKKEIDKLKTLQKYLKTGLPRYQDVLKEQGKELPKAPENIEYRSMGTMESQIFSVLKVKLCSGRKSFSKNGANYLSKVCAEYSETNGNIEIEKIEREIKIDNSVEEWIKEIEENVKKNKKMHRADRKETDINNYVQGSLIEKTPELKELLKLAEPTALMYR